MGNFGGGGGIRLVTVSVSRTPTAAPHIHRWRNLKEQTGDQNQ